MGIPSKVVEVCPGIFWVGVEDFQRRLFDSFVTLPYGTSYNAYLVVGQEKVALVDTVNPGFEEILLDKIAQVVEPKKIDYVVMNHAEPDHAGSIPRVLSVADHALLVTTEKGKNMADSLYSVPPERVKVVKDDELLNLGGKALRFVEAPWLHWPETMFTLAVEDKLLFSCDFFGTHLASDSLFDDEVSELLIPEAKKYYAEIMMPYQKMAAKGLDKAKGLELKGIAPSHGPVYRNPRRIIDAYEKWIRGPLEKKVLVLYVSMWGSTKRLAEVITATISAEGVTAVPYDLTVADVAHISSDLVDAGAVVIGSPTFVGGAHPLAAYTASLLRVLRPRAKLAGVFGSYGWGGGAVSQTKALLESCGLEIVDAFEVSGVPREKDIDSARKLGQAIAQRVKV